MRIGIVLACVISAVLLYLRAQAKATAFHDVERHLVHPWENTRITVLIVALCAAAVVAAIPVFRRDSLILRIGGGVVLLAPMFIVARFLWWVVHQWTTCE